MNIQYTMYNVQQKRKCQRKMFGEYCRHRRIAARSPLFPISPQPIISAISPQLITSAISPLPIILAICIAAAHYIGDMFRRSQIFSISPQPIFSAISPQPIISAISPQPFFRRYRRIPLFRGIAAVGTEIVAVGSRHRSRIIRSRQYRRLRRKKSRTIASPSGCGDSRPGRLYRR